MSDWEKKTTTTAMTTMRCPSPWRVPVRPPPPVAVVRQRLMAPAVRTTTGYEPASPNPPLATRRYYTRWVSNRRPNLLYFTSPNSNPLFTYQTHTLTLSNPILHLNFTFVYTLTRTLTCTLILCNAQPSVYLFIVP